MFLPPKIEPTGPRPWRGAIGILCLAMVSAASPSWAVLINQGSTTKQAENGLEWLDINLSTSRSYDQMLPLLGTAGSPFFGFRHATQQEVANLFISVGLSGINGGQQNPEPAGVALLNLMGATSTDIRNRRAYPQALGFTGTPGGAGILTASLLHRFGYYLAITSGSSFRTSAGPTLGHWLVRQGEIVPPPEGFLLDNPLLPTPGTPGCGLECFGWGMTVDQNDPFSLGRENTAYFAAPLTDGYDYSITSEQSNYLLFETVVVEEQGDLMIGDVLELVVEEQSFELVVGTPFSLFNNGLLTSTLTIRGANPPDEPLPFAMLTDGEPTLTVGFQFNGSFPGPTDITLLANALPVPEPTAAALAALALLGMRRRVRNAS